MLESFDAEVGASPKLNEEAVFQRAARDLTFQVQIPRTKMEQLGKSGPTATTLTDQRRHVRFHQLKRCIVRCNPTFPTIERTSHLTLGLVTNISKDGVGFLFPVQLYPKERFVLRIEGSGMIPLTVARCRKLGPQCYEIGATSIRPIDMKPFIAS
ncbi:hypothetical protein [Bremerella sp. P1]|uniref:hypothetical protein n=1 Tax=Bremerella sp. P1 TaxID=3026424 RepID=UPI002367D4F4|nr:hypothetical protein [Bremerella sp. P1]WDI42775.1 hypothetical protein PSR63_02300 [Bremerella sp. P1]